MRFRGTTIRRKIVALLLIPLVSLTAIWAFAATITGRAVFGRPDVQRIVDNVDYPARGRGQRGSSRSARSPCSTSPTAVTPQARIAFDKQEQATDSAVAKLRAQLSDLARARRPRQRGPRPALDDFLTATDGPDLAAPRVDDQRITREDTYDAYNSLVDPASTCSSASTRSTTSSWTASGARRRRPRPGPRGGQPPGRR